MDMIRDIIENNENIAIFKKLRRDRGRENIKKKISFFYTPSIPQFPHFLLPPVTLGLLGALPF